jgi:D-alanyl-D-alanine carboxypeptidase
MKFFKPIVAIALSLLLVVVLIPCGCGQDLDSHASIQGRLQDLLDRVVSENDVPGIVLQVVDSRQGQWSVASGMADIDSQAPMDPTYRFRCASNTKTFTAAAIMLLEQDGLLQLDDPIAKYVPELHIPLDSVITIRHLLAHQSGMVDYAGNTQCLDILQEDPLCAFTPEELVQASIDAGSDFYPGTQFSYCNTGYVVAALIIEKANLEGLTYPEFIKAYLLEPLGLTDTFVAMDWKIPGNYAHGYSQSDEDGFQDVTDINQSSAFGCGDMVSTVGDLASWIEALYEGQVLNSSSTTEIMDVSATGDSSHPYYGLGCMYDPGLGYGHNGGTAGYLSVMRYDTDNDVAIVTFMNEVSDDLHTLNDILYEIAYSAKRILGYEVPETP